MPSPQSKSEVIDNANTYMQQKFYKVPLLYDINQLVEPNAWNGEVHQISILKQ